MNLGPLVDAVQDATREALALVPRIWERDHTVWDEDPTELADRLGWLWAPERASAALPGWRDRVDEVVADGFTDVLLVGMGGSSLYPQVLAATQPVATGHPRLHVLDSTDPAAVLATEEALPWASTLLVAASKSGTTIETTCHLERFMARLREVHGPAAGRHVLAVTDPGTALDERASREGFRAVLHGEADVGGRFSALTAFGLVPAALLGVDVEAHLAPARRQLAAARSTDPDVNAPAVLGATLAAAVRAGRDKLTLLLPDRLAALGDWIEQLLAESTGKRGTGIVPVVGGSPEPGELGDDRIVLAWGEDAGLDVVVADGVPLVRLPAVTDADIAGEVVRLEFATAVAGALLGVNPFDQPDVAAAKQATAAALERGDPLPAEEDPATVLASAQRGDYVALLGFVTPGGADEQTLHRAAAALRRRLGLPVTVGIGPRYLHSTGQLHKGGPGTGIFLLAVGADPVDVEVPGKGLTFSGLKRAQAVGDLTALREAGRRVSHVSVDALSALAES